MDEKGYIQYRRRNDTDIDVVPHNLELLKLFDCHVNVEISHSIMLIMYLYKYFNKGNSNTLLSLIEVSKQRFSF